MFGFGLPFQGLLVIAAVGVYGCEVWRLLLLCSKVVIVDISLNNCR